MPKERRQRSGGHEKSVKLPKRQPIIQDDAIEHTQIDEGAPEVAEVLPILKKKEKQALKHEIFLRRLEASRTPYSKSHERRLKRKAKEQVGGGLVEMQAAITAVEDDIPVAVQKSVEDVSQDVAQDHPKPKPKPGQIGEGKGTPLTQAQRKRALQTERMRVPLILSNPAFAANPFQTIRTHAQNTLLKHEPPES